MSEFLVGARAWLPLLEAETEPHSREMDREIALALGWRVSRDPWWNWHPGPVFDPPGDEWCIRRDGRMDAPCNEGLPYFTAAVFARGAFREDGAMIDRAALELEEIERWMRLPAVKVIEFADIIHKTRDALTAQAAEIAELRTACEGLIRNEAAATDAESIALDARDAETRRADSAERKLKAAAEALRFYADTASYRLEGPLDPNSGNFEGDRRARAVLAEIGADHVV